MKFCNHASTSRPSTLTEQNDKKNVNDEDEVKWKEMNVAFLWRK
jgi:hypothetical protein